MKITGHELKQWMDEAWPGDDWYWDHDAFDDEPNPVTKYDTVEIGPVLFCSDVEGKVDPTDGEGLDLDLLIRKWRKTKTHANYVVTIKLGQVDEFLEYMKSSKFDVKVKKL